jgi:hypothetical protein
MPIKRLPRHCHGNTTALLRQFPREDLKMAETYTSKELATRHGLSERQCRNYLAAIRGRYPDLAESRGIWPAWICADFEEIQSGGLAAYRRNTQPVGPTPVEGSAIARIIPSSIEPAPHITRTEIAPYTGEGLSAAHSALALMQARLAAAEMELDERSHELDAHAQARDAALSEIWATAARLKAKQAAIAEREILEQERDRQLGKFAGGIGA